MQHRVQLVRSYFITKLHHFQLHGNFQAGPVAAEAEATQRVPRVRRGVVRRGRQLNRRGHNFQGGRWTATWTAPNRGKHPSEKFQDHNMAWE